MTDVTRFYPPLAVLVPVWSFLPVYDSAAWTSDLGTHFVVEYGSLWQMAGQGGGAYAMLGLVLAGALTTLLAMATLGVPKIAVPTTITALSTVTTVMLLAKPGTGDHPPALADTGVAAAALTTCTAAIALWHAAALLTTTSRTRRTAALADDLHPTAPEPRSDASRGMGHGTRFAGPGTSLPHVTSRPEHPSADPAGTLRDTAADPPPAATSPVTEPAGTSVTTDADHAPDQSTPLPEPSPRASHE